MWYHTQNSPGFGPWGFDSPSRHQDPKNRRADAPKAGFHVSRLLEPVSHIRELG